MSLKIGKVHDWTSVIKMINDVPHFPEEGKKGKIKWQATVVDPKRLETFEDTEMSEEDAYRKMKDDNKRLLLWA